MPYDSNQVEGQLRGLLCRPVCPFYGIVRDTARLGTIYELVKRLKRSLGKRAI